MSDLDLILGDDDVLLGYDGFDGELEGDDDYASVLSGKPRKKKRTLNIQRQAMPFPRTSVAAGVTTTVTAFPQRKLVLERFVFGSVAAASFTVDELKVGQDSMLVNTGNIPAEVFAQTGVGVTLSGYVAKVGSTVSLTCTNISGAAAFISAAIIGHVKVFD